MNRSQIARTKARTERHCDFSSRRTTTYVCEFNCHQLQAVLQRIAPVCDICNGAKLHICVQACCRSQALFCELCDSDEHFLHATNELALLLFEQATTSYGVTTTTKDKGEIVDSIISSLRQLQVIKMKNRYKNYLERRAQELKEIESALSFFELQSGKGSMFQIKSLKMIVRKAISLLRESDDRNVMASEWQLCRKGFATLCGKIEILRSHPIQPNFTLCGKIEMLRYHPVQPNFSVVWELEQQANSYNRKLLGTQLLRTLIEQYYTNTAAIVQATCIGNFVGSQFLKKGLSIANRSVYLSPQELSLQTGELPKRIILPAAITAYFSSTNPAFSKRMPQIIMSGRIEQIAIEDCADIKFPENLKSLSIGISESNRQLLLPPNLRKLCLVVKQRSYRTQQLSPFILKQVTCLVHLRELTISSQSGISTSSARQLIEFAQQINLRMLRFECSNSHQREVLPLKLLDWHYANYRRALVQGAMLMKRMKLGRVYWAENILEAAETLSEQNKPTVSRDINIRRRALEEAYFARR